jgi:hypothetical protein
VVASGGTDPSVLLRWVRANVKVCSRPGLHAKSSSPAARGAVGSANASADSAENLYETVLVTDNPDVRRQARQQVEALARDEPRLTEDILRTLQPLFNTWPRGSYRQRRVTRRLRSILPLEVGRVVGCWYGDVWSEPASIHKPVDECIRGIPSRFIYVPIDWGEHEEDPPLTVTAGDLLIAISETPDGECWILPPELVDEPGLDGGDGRTWPIGIQDTHLERLNWEDIASSPVWDKVEEVGASDYVAATFTLPADIADWLAPWALGPPIPSSQA